MKIAYFSEENPHGFKHMREEIQGETAWHQLGALLYKMGNFDKAEEVCQILLRETSKDDEDGLNYLYQQLGCIKDSKGGYEEALQLHQKSLEIMKKCLSSNLLDFTIAYNNIGQVHDSMGEYSKALEFYQKSLEIMKKSLPPNHPNLAATYSNIGLAHVNMGEYLKALEFYQKPLDIRRKSLSPNHPDLSQIYNNIGLTHVNMGEHSNPLEIQKGTWNQTKISSSKSSQFGYQLQQYGSRAFQYGRVFESTRVF